MSVSVSLRFNRDGYASDFSADSSRMARRVLCVTVGRIARLCSRVVVAAPRVSPVFFPPFIPKPKRLVTLVVCGPCLSSTVVAVCGDLPPAALSCVSTVVFVCCTPPPSLWRVPIRECSDRGIARYVC